MVSYDDNWEYCVSISAGGYLSLSWEEFFFMTEDDASNFYKQKKNEGYAVLMVDKDGY